MKEIYMSEFLPTTSKWVELNGLHPRFRHRLSKLLSDPAVKGSKIVSGARTFEMQKRLFDKYKSGRGNLAANPNRQFGPKGKNGKRIFQGSWHQIQSDEHPEGPYCYAADIRLPKGLSWDIFSETAKKYGIYQTVFSPKFEPWHYQPYGYLNGKWQWFPAPALENDAADTAKVKKAEHPLKIWAAATAEARKHTLRRGDRGPHVLVLQTYLDKEGFSPSRKKNRSGLDSVFGNQTRRAVIEFQRNECIVGKPVKVDGVAGKQVWAALLDD